MSEPTTDFPVGKRDAGKRLDRFLNEKIPGLSRSRIQQAIRERVTLSWEACARPSTPTRPGGEVRIGYTPIAETPLEVDLPVIARGPGWLAVDKPAGLPVHPFAEDETGTMLNAVLARRPEIFGVGEGGLRSGVVHRLDVDTSGVLLFASEAGSWRRLPRANCSTFQMARAL